MQDRSSAPHRRPLRCSKATELAVLSVRSDHPIWGGRKIASHLQLFGAAAVPAPSTITAILIRNGRFKTSTKQSAHIWLLATLHKDVNADELPHSIISHPDLQTLLERLKSGRLTDRRRSIAVLGDRSGLQIGSICTAFNLSRLTYRRYVCSFDEGGAAALFAARISPLRKFDKESVKKAVFSLLHQPPSNFASIVRRGSWPTCPA